MGVSASIGAGAAMGYVAGEGAKTTANYNQRLLNANAEMEERQAGRVIARGEADANKAKQNARRTIGAQRAALAAQGVDVDFGSALDIQTETEIVGIQNATTIKNNAVLEAFGLQSSAINKRFQGEIGVMTAENQQRMSIITGGMQGFQSAGGFNFGSGSGSTPVPKGDVKGGQKVASNLEYADRMSRTS